MALPPCGIYRTTAPIGSVPADRLVYFHNHGNPDAGIYPPKTWKGNRAEFDTKGTVLPEHSAAENLEPLLKEGFYRVIESFHCCQKKCRLFEAESLVQLGYNKEAKPILFTPEFTDGMLGLPKRGSFIDTDALDKIKPLKVLETKADAVRH